MNYYNENDPRAAQWLRQLIKDGLIPPGDVDERDIQLIQSHELTAYTQCHFFAGIGGWSVALRLAGWPDSEPVWTGSCPCQPFSVSGKGMAEDDERHLWPDFRNLIGQRQPSVVFGEQVASKLGREWLAGVSADMEALAYRFAAADLCAAGVGAPHRRQRLFWVANAEHCDRRGEQQPGKPQQDGRARPSGSGEARGLADATSRGLGINGSASRKPGHPYEREQAGRLDLPDGDGWSEGKPPSTTAGHRNAIEPAGGSGRLLLAGQSGLEGQSGHGDDRSEPGRLDQESNRPTAAAGGAGAEGVDNSASARFESQRERSKVETRNEARMRGLERGRAWSDYDILPFRDGKARRVEAGTFPLAHGVSGRVGLLRGYGNAIVPQIAAKFIQAWRETH